MSKKNFKAYKKCTEPVKIMPESIQDAIPVHMFSESGIFQLENKKDSNVYDKMYTFDDINYNLKDEDGKLADLEKWVDILGTLQLSHKVVVQNRERDIDVVRKEVALEPLEDTPINVLSTNAYNKHIEKLQMKGKINVDQKKYIILSCVKDNIEEAKLYFNNIENSIEPFYNSLGTKLRPLNAIERLGVLHSVYRPGEEKHFNLRWDAIRLGRDFRNDIAPRQMKEMRDHLDFGTFKGAVLYASGLPETVRDGFVGRLTSQLDFPCLCTVDMSPIPKDITRDQLNTALNNANGSIDRQQQRNNKRGAFTTEPSRETKQEQKTLNKYLDEVDENDQTMCYTSIMVYVTGKDDIELNTRIERIKQQGTSDYVVFDAYINRQQDAFNTVLPTAARYVNIMRPLMLDSLAAICPFDVSDMYQEDGIVYGINKNSKNIVRVNRKRLKNGNGFIYAPPGSGKSFFVKNELTQLLLFTDDDIMVLDPANEYMQICNLFGGQVINFTMNTNTHINPMQVPVEVYEDASLRGNFVSEKCEFMQNLFINIEKGQLSGTQTSIIDRCVRTQYEKVFEKYDLDGVIDEPTLKEYRVILKEEKNNKDTNSDVVTELHDAMDIYVNGSLNIFSHKSNVDLNNRFTVFGIRDLGKSLWKSAMLMIMEIMSTKLEFNRDNHRTTHVYGDEIHTVLDDDDSAKQWDKLWRMARKDGGLATGITQVISDSGTSRFALNMMKNSETLVILAMQKSDRENIPNVIDISGAELDILKGQSSGIALFKYGDTNIILDGRMEKEKNVLYWMFTTDPKEKREKDKVIAKLVSRVEEMEAEARDKEQREREESEQLAEEMISFLDDEEYVRRKEESLNSDSVKEVVSDTWYPNASQTNEIKVDGEEIDPSSEVNEDALSQEEIIANDENNDSHKADDADCIREIIKDQLEENGQKIEEAVERNHEHEEQLDYELEDDEKIYCFECGHQVMPSWKHCKSCGTALKIHCVDCGSPLRDTDSVCKRCGKTRD